MLIRDAREEDAEAACTVLRRSITELCHVDHRGDVATLALWLANKTPENVRHWINGEGSQVLVAVAGDAILGVGAVQRSGRIVLNYVSPDARFRGVSKALVVRLEEKARDLGASTCTLESTATALRLYVELGYAPTEPPSPGFGKSLRHPMAKQLPARR